METQVALETLFWVLAQYGEMLTFGVYNTLTTLCCNKKTTDTEIPVSISTA